MQKILVRIFCCFSFSSFFSLYWTKKSKIWSYCPKYYKPAHSSHFVRHRVQWLIDPIKVSLSASRLAAPHGMIDRRPAESKVVVGVEALWSLLQRAPLAWLEVFIKIGAFPEDQNTTNKLTIKRERPLHSLFLST